MSLAIVGTDTEIGKTVTSALVLARYGGSRRLAYWKPIATGLDDDDRDTDTVRSLAGGRGEVRPEAFLYGPPVSPHLAARWADRPIEVDALDAAWRTERARGVPVVVEGIGGVLVPIDDRGTPFAWLLERWQLPCLLVARSTLGTINHTLLTLEALRTRGIGVLGVALVGAPNADNREAIERFGSVPVVGEIPLLQPLDAEHVARAAAGFDVAGRLEGALESP